MNFGKIPVEFVPPGMTAEEARRRRKRQMGPGRQDLITGLGSIVLLLLLCAGAGWYYVGRGQAEEVTQTSTPAPVALEPAQITATAAAGLPTHSPALIPQNPPTPLPSPVAVLASVIQSPLPTPFPLLASIITTPTNTPLPAKVAAIEAAPANTPTPAPPPTATPWPYDYQIIGREVRASDLYSYVSGWIVEQDGTTPRPARVRLRFATGEMLYPRPNNRDVANGHYEFLAGPGRYWLEVDDGQSPVVQIDIADGERHEISFQSTRARPLTTPARSSPWYEPGLDRTTKSPQVAPAVVAPAEMKYKLFLPLMINKRYGYIAYFPIVHGGDSE